MSIHSEHPFLPPPADRDPARRLRGRLPSPVTVWATGTGSDRAGLTVSSVLVAAGEPDRLLALLDPDADLTEELLDRRTAAVSVLAAGHQAVADVFAGQAPSPGGMFRTGDWTDTDWGPALADAPAWAGVRLDAEPEPYGWALLVRVVLERVEVVETALEPLAVVRGRYRSIGADR